MAGAIGAIRVPGGFQKILQSAVGCGFDGRYGQHGAFVSELLHPRYWPSWLAVGLVRALGLLPLPVLWGLGTCIGRIAYWFAGSRRGVARRNMEICLSDRSDRDREALLKQSFGWLGVAALSQGIGWGISRTRLRRLVKMRNVKVIDDCFEQGRPVILLVPHFVGVDLAGLAFAGLQRPGVCMYQKIRDPVIDRQVRRSRTRFGSLLVERNDDLRRLIREIRKGEPLFYLPDQNANRRTGIFVPFCGFPASTVPMLGRFAEMTGAAVVPLIPRYLPRGHGLVLTFDAPLADFPSGDLHADTAAMNCTVERHVRLLPEQYFWVHRRFKTRPEGEPPFYGPRALEDG